MQRVAGRLKSMSLDTPRRPQIHSWGRSFDDETPNLEYIAPATVYAVVAGERTYLDLRTIPSLTPRQIRALSRGPAAEGRLPSGDDEVCHGALPPCQCPALFVPFHLQACTSQVRATHCLSAALHPPVSTDSCRPDRVARQRAVRGHHTHLPKTWKNMDGIPNQTGACMLAAADLRGRGQHDDSAQHRAALRIQHARAPAGGQAARGHVCEPDGGVRPAGGALLRLARRLAEPHQAGRAQGACGMS